MGTKILGELPLGAKIKDKDSTLFQSPVVFQLADKNHGGYPANSVTLITEKSIALQCFDAMEVFSVHDALMEHGNNRYLYSNIRQWLNSEKGGAEWYIDMYEDDYPPLNKYATNCNYYYHSPGFLNQFSESFKSILMNTNLVSAKNTLLYEGGTEVIQDKVFLLSAAEVGFQMSVAEGSALPIFAGDEDRVACCTEQAITKSTYSANPANTATPWGWWLRSPFVTKMDTAYYVSGTGTLSSAFAYSGQFGIRPACNVSYNTKVSALPDEDGCYEIVYNTAPNISGMDEDLGEIHVPLIKTYSITDDEGDLFSRIERLDDTVIRNAENQSSGSFTLSLTDHWVTMEMGQHSVTITATDGKGAASIRSWQFTKCNAAPAVPEILHPLPGSRVGQNFFAEFIMSKDLEGDQQYFKAQSCGSENFETGVVEFTEPLERWDAPTGSWQEAVCGLDEDVGKRFRIPITGLAKDSSQFFRILSTDRVGSGQTTATQPIPIHVGEFLVIQTMPKPLGYQPVEIAVRVKENRDGKTEGRFWVTNNGFDDFPIWEEATEQLKKGNSYVFTNKTKTAERWGYAVKYQIAAGASTGEIAVALISAAAR